MAATNLDEILHQLGKYGRYQVVCAVIIMTIGNWFPAWHMMGIIFIADSPVGYRCITLTAPRISQNNGLSSDNASYDSLAEAWTGNLSRNTEECTVPGTDEACTEWQYITRYNESSVVIDLNLICDRKVLAETAQSIYLVGMMVGSLVLGYLCDTVGRKKVLLLACLAHGVCGIVVAFVWNYVPFVMLWFFVGLFSQGYNQVQFVVVMEMFPPECRTLMGSLNNMFWGLGVITLTPIAYLLKDWRHMQLAISLPCLIAVPLWFVLDDSVRWLISKGRLDEAIGILNKMARWNKTPPPVGGFVLTDEVKQHRQLNSDDEDKISDGEVTKELATKELGKKSCTYLDVLKSRRLLLNTVIIYFCWFVSMMAYYGASLNSAHLAGNKYANFFFLGLVEIPAFFIIHFTMTWWGRRPSMGLFFFISGLASVGTAFIPKQTDTGTNLTVAIVVMAILAKLCITCALSINLIFCSEIFPTPVRSIGFGVGAVVANMGTIVAPFVLYLGEFVPFLPLTIFGGLSMLAAFLIPILPETGNKLLPETIEDAKHLWKKSSRHSEKVKKGSIVTSVPLLESQDKSSQTALESQDKSSQVSHLLRPSEGM